MDSLRRLVNINSFGILQDKLDRWLSDYKINTCDQNVARGCEIIELNARVQGQLFKLLSICASEGGLYGGASVIRARLLPLMGRSFFSTGLSSQTSLDMLVEAAAGGSRQVEELRHTYEKSLDELDDDLKHTRFENSNLKAELEETRIELERQSRASTSDKMFTDAELRDTRNKLEISEAENDRLRSKVLILEDYERQARSLRDEVAILTGRRDTYTRRARSTSPVVDGIAERDVVEDTVSSQRFLPRSVSPALSARSGSGGGEQALIARFNDMFSVGRLDAMDTLRRYSDDHEMNQRVCFAAFSEAFNVARIAFRATKSRVRSKLAITHLGPPTLDEAVQDYIDKNVDMLCDVAEMIQDVTRVLNRSSRVCLPIGVSFAVIQPFIREACRLAWEMLALACPLDIALATDGELMDEHKYRRSFDSEYTAPLVSHHIWPSLMQGSRILAKGEACTRRGASMGSPRRGRSPTRTPSRSSSPYRNGLPHNDNY